MQLPVCMHLCSSQTYSALSRVYWQSNTALCLPREAVVIQVLWETFIIQWCTLKQCWCLQHSNYGFRSCCCPVSKLDGPVIDLYLYHDVAAHKASDQVWLRTKHLITCNCSQSMPLNVTAHRAWSASGSSDQVWLLTKHLIICNSMQSMVSFWQCLTVSASLSSATAGCILVTSENKLCCYVLLKLIWKVEICWGLHYRETVHGYAIEFQSRALLSCNISFNCHLSHLPLWFDSCAYAAYMEPV